MVGFTMVMEPEQRDFLEVYRRQQGLYSIADSARELIHLGIQSAINIAAEKTV